MPAYPELAACVRQGQAAMGQAWRPRRPGLASGAQLGLGHLLSSSRPVRVALTRLHVERALEARSRCLVVWVGLLLACVGHV